MPVPARRFLHPPAKRAKVPFSPPMRMAWAMVGRAWEFGETRGFMKVLVDAETRQILGASILGLRGIRSLDSQLDTGYARPPYTVISRATHNHRTVTDLVPTLLQGLEPLSDPGSPPSHEGTLWRSAQSTMSGPGRSPSSEEV